MASTQHFLGEVQNSKPQFVDMHDHGKPQQHDQQTLHLYLAVQDWPPTPAATGGKRTAREIATARTSTILYRTNTQGPCRGVRTHMFRGNKKQPAFRTGQLPLFLAARKIIIKHCGPLGRLAKLYLRSKGVVHWKEGGCRFSGTGSSQKLVQAKVRKMLRYFNVSSTWPSKRLAAEKRKLRLQPPLRLTPVRRLSRPLGRSAPPTRGRWEMLPESHAPAPRLAWGGRTPTDWRRSPCRTWQETMNLPTLLQSFSIRPNRGRQNCMTCTYFPEQLSTFWWGLSTPKKKTSNKMTSRHQPWLTPSLPYCPLHFSNCICSSFMTSRWKGAYKQ